MLRWLLNGHPVDDWPGWSRILVTVDDARAQAVVHTGREIDAMLRKRGLRGGLSKVIISVYSWPVRGIDPETEWALEDLDALIATRFGSLPAVATINGVAR